MQKQNSKKSEAAEQNLQVSHDIITQIIYSIIYYQVCYVQICVIQRPQASKTDFRYLPFWTGMGGLRQRRTACFLCTRSTRLQTTFKSLKKNTPQQNLFLSYKSNYFRAAKIFKVRTSQIKRKSLHRNS